MGSEGVVEVERGLGMRRENEKGVGSSYESRRRSSKTIRVRREGETNELELKGRKRGR